MVNWNSRRLEGLLRLAIGLVVLIILNILASEYFYRLDLTEEGRYSIKGPTKELLRSLDDVVYVEVYLDGELNSGFKRLQRSIRETLEEFQAYAGDNIQFMFNDPTRAMGQQAKGEFMQALSEKGIQPTNIIDNQNGQRVERLVFPGAIVSYGGVEEGVMLLRGNQALTAEEKLNQSIENIEYELAATIHKLTGLDQKTIGISTGHGELNGKDIASFTTALAGQYGVKKIGLTKAVDHSVDALVIAKPTVAFAEGEKYNLDQYLMNGGKIMLLMDKLHANMDSAANEHNFAFAYDLNLDDQLFKYGVRVNPDLVQESTAGVYPVVVGNMGDQPQVQLIRWPFYAVINRFGHSAITKNLDAIIGRFVSSVDTIAVEGVAKQPLLFTSNYSRTVSAPVKVSVQDLRKNLTPEMLNQRQVPLGWLLEGRFTSLYKNRFKPEGVKEGNFKESSNNDARLIVIGDGDIARNDINPRNGAVQELGYDPFMENTFANKDFLMNAIAYLVDSDGLILARNKEVKIRPLDDVRVERNKAKWQIINMVVPVLIILVFGVIRHFIRKRKYTGF